MLNYWNETLENISKDHRAEKFEIILNDIKHKVPLSYALGISPLITENYLKEPTYNKFEININNDDTELDEKIIQEEFVKFMNGQYLSRDVYFAIGVQLQNKEMIEEWNKSREKYLQLHKINFFRNLEKLI